MSTKHAVHLATCVAIIAFAIGLALPAFVAVPVLWYRPVEHEWLLDLHASGVAMDFFGRCLLATVISVVATATTYLIARRVCRRDPRPVTTTVFGVWAIAITVIAIAFFAWREMHRQLPPGSAGGSDQQLIETAPVASDSDNVGSERTARCATPID